MLLTLSQDATELRWARQGLNKLRGSIKGEVERRVRVALMLELLVGHDTQSSQFRGHTDNEHLAISLLLLASVIFTAWGTFVPGNSGKEINAPLNPSAA